MTKNRKAKSPIICRCNSVNRETIEKAIREGCDSMNKIFDATSAGVGPCGGSCRRKLQPLLNHFLQTGTFPDKIVEDLTGKTSAKKDDDASDPLASETTKKPSDENQ